jgi:exodeoxyribonuclease VII small subunit
VNSFSSINNDEIPVENMSYEQALSDLERIVAALEAEDLSLENSLAMFERGQALARRCTELLDQAELRVHQLVGDNLIEFEG